MHEENGVFGDGNVRFYVNGLKESISRIKNSSCVFCELSEFSDFCSLVQR